MPLKGKIVLVDGAAGGVGHFAVQIAKLKGAHVIAVASGRNEPLLRDLGADEFIDYIETPPEEVAHGLDLVIDTLGGPTSERFLRTLGRGGALFPFCLWVFLAPGRLRGWAQPSRPPKYVQAGHSWQK